MDKLDASPRWTKWTTYGVLAEEEDCSRDRVLCHSIPLISLLPTQKIEQNTAVRLENGGNDWVGEKKSLWGGVPANLREKGHPTFKRLHSNLASVNINFFLL